MNILYIRTKFKTHFQYKDILLHNRIHSFWTFMPCIFVNSRIKTTKPNTLKLFSVIYFQFVGNVNIGNLKTFFHLLALHVSDHNNSHEFEIVKQTYKSCCIFVYFCLYVATYFNWGGQNTRFILLCIEKYIENPFLFFFFFLFLSFQHGNIFILKSGFILPCCNDEKKNTVGLSIYFFQCF